MTMCRVITNSAQGVGNGSDPGIGGGLYFAAGTNVILKTIISRNRAFSATALSSGGGMANYGGQVVLQNCLVDRNDSGNNVADGIQAASGSMNLLNCTVANNSGVGIGFSGGTMAITNSIIWGNGDDLTGTVSVVYSDIQTADTFWTNGVKGCISVDPLFVDSVYYHLQSRMGQYMGGYFSGGNWDVATNDSPCVDAGDPASAFNWEPSPNGMLVNMGAYGNTEVASMKFMQKGTILTVY